MAAVGSGSAHAAFPGTNGKIVFDRNGDLYVLNVNGSPAMPLLATSASETDATWSPDGHRIAFQSDAGGDTDVYTMNLDGSALTNVTNSAGFDGQPAWSPDGTQIAFSSERDGNREIYVWSSSSGLRRLTTNTVWDGSPAWSPEGTRIAFATERDGNREIYTMDASDGSNLVRVTTNSVPDDDPNWSPDGSRLAFGDVSRYCSNTGIHVVNTVVSNPDGSNAVTIAAAQDPSWSPDGTELAVARPVPSQPCSNRLLGIWTMLPNGASPQQLTSQRFVYDHRPDWQSLPSPQAKADLVISNMTSSASEVPRGSDVTFTILAGNAGPDPATSVALVDQLPPGLSFKTASSTKGRCGGAPLVTCRLGTLVSQQEVTITITATVASTSSGILNVASYKYGYEADPNGINDFRSVVVTVALADLSLSGNDSPDPIAEDVPLHFFVTVTNSGPVAAKNARLVATFSAPVAVDPASASLCAGGGTQITCTLGTLAPGSYGYGFDVDLSSQGELATTIDVMSDTEDPDSADTHIALTTRVAPPGCTIIGTDSDDVLSGNRQANTICGLKGNDTIDPRDGNDTVYGGDGDDHVLPGSGADLIYGGAGADSLEGGVGDDTLYGEKGVDYLDGGDGNDLCDVGPDGGTTFSCEGTPPPPPRYF